MLFCATLKDCKERDYCAVGTQVDEILESVDLILMADQPKEAELKFSCSLWCGENFSSHAAQEPCFSSRRFEGVPNLN